ncbi:PHOSPHOLIPASE D [Salix purpurea]|uniref:Phospholipase D n=1 Tax=Salix purpurea TaxID=77065 RepID=A0A9Q0QHM4_SALPP|nr:PHOSPHOLIPASE D [Salix purpurea]
MSTETNVPRKTQSTATQSSKESVFLHGELDIWILEAKSLPNMDLASENMRKCFTMCGSYSPLCGHGPMTHSGKHSIITSDPYVSVCLAGATVAQTRVIANCENPLWDEHFCVPVAHPVAKVEFHVKDNDFLGAQLIGVVENGVGDGPEYKGVPNTYFPLRKGGSVTLYQDAHVPDAVLPKISLDDGKVFQHSSCWEDICHAILEAHNLIYIVGWSVYHRVKLVREPTKAIACWRRAYSWRVVEVQDGVMQTHDEETKKFFKHSSVHCVLAPRYASNKLSVFKQQVVGTLFSHHQKCVILDTQSSGNNRKITSFIGGLDLCDGRYDTPEHRLFRDLDTVFENDFHNPTFPSNTKNPRQPWHDLHCKIEGPAAYDILTNFEQRWKKATKWRRIKKVTRWHDDALIKLERISWILTPSSSPDGDKIVHVTDEGDPENWHVQVFRSIDSGSVTGFPKSTQEAVAQNLVCGKNLKVDKSIHTAYVKAIRSAQHFIYIENQYFLGSSYYWPSYKNAGADNLVPMELALKIAGKIRANERFSVYIVIPMWPEGVPTSAPVQEILYWQGQTMAMMYRIIANELEKAGLAHKYHPQDYLNFYCLGKRENSPQNSSEMNQQTENRSLAAAQKFRRFMIYVHAKGMIVDDEYVIMGSANINQRSLDGSRDTEIAMGAYQPTHTWARKNSHPHGQVYGYRMSLWAEHLGVLEKAFDEPQNLECMKLVNRTSRKNWKAYVSEESKEMRGNLMQYPIQVSRSGKVSAIQGHETFPDVGGKVLGASTNLPDVLTT